MKCVTRSNFKVCVFKSRNLPAAHSVRHAFKNGKLFYRLWHFEFYSVFHVKA